MIITTERSIPGVFLDAALTALGWLCFLYLLTQGVLSIVNERPLGPDVPFWTQVMPTLHTLTVYMIVAALNGSLLLSWAMYNRRRFARADRRKSLPRLQDGALMRSFGVSQEQLAGLRSTDVAVIHHAEDGQIMDIEVLPAKVTWLPTAQPPARPDRDEVLATA